MSKIGKINISIPEKVKVALAGNILNIEGPSGKKSINIDLDVFNLDIKDGKEISIKPKKIVMNKKLPLEERFKAQQKLSKLPRNSAKVRVMNRCQITGRPHGVYRKLKISRIALRQLGLQGKIPGLVKSSW